MTFNWKKIITAGAVLAGAAALFVGANAVKPTHVHAADNASTVSAIKKRGQLRVAVFGDLPPYGWEGQGPGR